MKYGILASIKNNDDGLVKYPNLTWVDPGKSRWITTNRYKDKDSMGYFETDNINEAYRYLAEVSKSDPKATEWALEVKEKVGTNERPLTTDGYTIFRTDGYFLTYDGKTNRWQATKV